MNRTKKVPGVIKCRFCPVKFTDYKALVNHVAEVHAKIKVKQ